MKLSRKVLETFREEGMEYAYVGTLENDILAKRL